MLGNFINAFRQGKQLTNSATWKNRAVATSALTVVLGALLAIAKVFGYDLPIDDETLQALAGGIAAAVIAFNGVVQLTTSKTVGLPAVSEPEPPVVPPSPPNRYTSPDSTNRDQLRS